MTSGADDPALPDPTTRPEDDPYWVGREERLTLAAQAGGGEQVATIRAWMESAAKRDYRPTDKRRYAVRTIDGSACTAELETAIEIIEESECEYTLTDRWLTQPEYEALPEFKGW